MVHLTVRRIREIFSKRFTIFLFPSLKRNNIFVDYLERRPWWSTVDSEASLRDYRSRRGWKRWNGPLSVGRGLRRRPREEDWRTPRRSGCFRPRQDSRAKWHLGCSVVRAWPGVIERPPELQWRCSEVPVSCTKFAVPLLMEIDHFLFLFSIAKIFWIPSKII